MRERVLILMFVPIFMFGAQDKYIAEKITHNLDSTDFFHRQSIANFLEYFQTAYDTKDYTFFEQVFADGTIVVGKDVVTISNANGIDKQIKQNYLVNLKHAFASDNICKVIVDDIKVVVHPINSNFYGVTLHQEYVCNGYINSGYLFLLWDFSSKQMPFIHASVWQPDLPNGDRISEDDVMGLYYFDI